MDCMTNDDATAKGGVKILNFLYDFSVGTLIRIWDCHTGEPLRELRRGMDRAEIYCLCFNPTSTFLACSSDKGTIHIFSLAEGAHDNTAATPENKVERLHRLPV